MPSPGILMLAFLEKLEIFIFAILRLAELGFFGETVKTDKQIAFF